MARSAVSASRTIPWLTLASSLRRAGSTVCARSSNSSSTVSQRRWAAKERSLAAPWSVSGQPTVSPNSGLRSKKRARYSSASASACADASRGADGATESAGARDEAQPAAKSSVTPSAVALAESPSARSLCRSSFCVMARPSLSGEGDYAHFFVKRAIAFRTVFPGRVPRLTGEACATRAGDSWAPRPSIKQSRSARGMAAEGSKNRYP